MLKGKSLIKVVALLLVVTLLLQPMSVFAAESAYPGRLVTSSGVSMLWLSPGIHTQYPNTGGVWEYGFWDAKVRSYYTVDRCHGSTVVYNGKEMRSADTQAGKKSIAEKWAVNWPTNDDEYYYRVCK
jgi:hypothetical protein